MKLEFSVKKIIRSLLKMNNEFAFLFILSISISCNNQANKSQTIETEKINHTQEFFLVEELLRPDMFCVIDSVIIIYDKHRNGNAFFHAFNLNNGEEYAEFGTIGMGSDDLNYPAQIDFCKEKNEVEIFDRNYSKLYFYKLNDIINDKFIEVRQIKIAPEADRIIHKNDSLLYCLGALPESGMFWESKNGKRGDSFMKFPDVKNESLNSIQKYMLYQGELKMKPDRKKFVYVSTRCDLFKIISIETEVLNEISNRQTYSPKFRQETGNTMAIMPENLNGFISVTVTNEHIFALFSGRSETNYQEKYYFGNIVHIYNWDGDLLKSVMLDKDAWQIYVDDFSMKLYTIHYEMTNIDNTVQYYGYNLDFLSFEKDCH